MDYWLLTLITFLNLSFTVAICLLLFRQQKQIERLLQRPQQVIRWNDDAQHLLSVIPGHINVGGGIELHAPYPSYLKYRGLAIEVQVVAKNQREMLRSG